MTRSCCKPSDRWHTESPHRLIRLLRRSRCAVFTAEIAREERRTDEGLDRRDPLSRLTRIRLCEDEREFRILHRDDIHLGDREDITLLILTLACASVARRQSSFMPSRILAFISGVTLMTSSFSFFASFIPLIVTLKPYCQSLEKERKGEKKEKRMSNTQ